MTTKTNLLRFLFVGWMAIILWLPSALGQTVTGSITGLVTDPSGAVVVGANVTAANTATGVKATTQTNGTGVYTIRFLPMWMYTLTVEAKAFTTAKVDAFTLEID